MGLRTIMTTQKKDIDEFFKKLLLNDQNKETLRKCESITIDKLKGMQDDLVWEEGWRDWYFGQLQFYRQ